MTRTGLTRRLAGACAAASALAFAVPATAGAATTSSGLSSFLASLAAKATSSCTAPTLSTPFASSHDSALYAALPGESVDSFTGTGWILGGGAKIVTTKLADGTSGSVLDLLAGSYAISASACVTNLYPTARLMVKSVSGSPTVELDVAYLSASPSFTKTGAITATTTWSLSPVLNINPSPASGWQLAWFSLVNTGTSGEMQVYDLYVDPRMKS
jgi:hypothetical protein